MNIKGPDQAAHIGRVTRAFLVICESPFSCHNTSKEYTTCISSSKSVIIKSVMRSLFPKYPFRFYLLFVGSRQANFQLSCYERFQYSYGGLSAYVLQNTI